MWAQKFGSKGSKRKKRLDRPGAFESNKRQSILQWGEVSVKLRKWKNGGSYLSYAMTYFFFMFSMAVFSSVLSVYLTGIGKSPSEMSLIVSAAGVFSFLMVPVTGFLNDRVNNPKLITRILLLGAGILGLIFSQCRSIWALFLLNGLIMSSINSMLPICERMAGACKYRYGTIRIWGTLGYASGAQAAGLAVQSLPSLFLFGLLTCSAILAVVGFTGVDPNSLSPKKEEKEAEPAEELPAAGKRHALSSFLKSPYFFLFLAIAFLFSGCSGANMTYVPILLTGMGLSAGTVGTVLFVSTVVEIPLILFSNKFMDRFSGKLLMIASLVIITVQFLIYGFSRSPGVIVAAIILLKAVASTLYVMISLKIVRNLISPKYTTTGLAVVNSVNNLASILVQNTAGLLADRLGVHTMYLCFTALTGLAVVLTLFLKVENRERVFS